MSFDTTKSKSLTPIKQFSVYAENKVGRLNDLMGILAANEVHIIAISTVDSTDSSIIRLIVDYPEAAAALLEENNFAFSEVEIVGVEINSIQELKTVTCALVQAEINIHYIYPLLLRPNNKSALALRLEDNELAVAVLKQHQIVVLTQQDISR